MEKIPLGTYKTLSRSKEAFKTMSVLNAEFVFALNDFVVIAIIINTLMIKIMKINAQKSVYKDE